jgi:hypothetical protein
LASLAIAMTIGIAVVAAVAARAPGARMHHQHVNVQANQLGRKCGQAIEYQPFEFGLQRQLTLKPDIDASPTRTEAN